MKRQELKFKVLQERAESIRFRVYKTADKQTTKEESEILTEYAQRTGTSRNWRAVSLAKRMNFKR